MNLASCLLLGTSAGFTQPHREKWASQSKKSKILLFIGAHLVCLLCWLKFRGAATLDIQAFIATVGFGLWRCGCLKRAGINNPERVLSLAPFSLSSFGLVGQFLLLLCDVGWMDGFLETSQRSKGGRKGIYDRTSYLRWHLAFNSNPSQGVQADLVLYVRW